jgi:hypothetical protein
MNEPSTVPTSAESGSKATMAALTWYSLRIPGVTKPRLAGFITSITSATASTSITCQCARDSGASSGGAITSWVSPSLDLAGTSP